MRSTEALIALTLALVACTATQTSTSAPTTTPPPTDVDGGEPAPADGGAEAEAAVPPGPSCAPGGTAGTANDCAGQSCCASATAPGGTFFRWKNGASPSPQDDHPATVSAFTLDVFEVTVGRFRRFVDAGFGTRANPPAQGSGAHPKIPGSGWKSAWNVLLPQDRIALDSSILAQKPVTIWTQGAGPNETKPMKGIGYALAFAFCAWDGGRLPTLAEWNFAAMGGDESRTFPWGNTIGHDRAVYDCRNEGEDIGCDPVDLLPVGSKPEGIGRWGHFDLVGSVKEWALDSDPDLMPCKDCGIVDPTGNWSVVMGGSFWSPEIGQVTAGAIVMKDEPTADHETGVRCARDRGAAK
jgi:formylglycine-generating enzyme required for sulfatase activity